MSAPPENGPQNRVLYCELCDYIPFSSYPEFYQHHISHVRVPQVCLTRLSRSVLDQANRGVYRINAEVSRDNSESINQAPPIQLSVVREDGWKHIVISKKQPPGSNKSRSSPNRDLKRSAVVSNSKMKEEKEDCLKRRDCRVSVTRRKKVATLTKSKTTNPRTPKKGQLRGKESERNVPKVDFGLGDTENMSASSFPKEPSSDFTSISLMEPRPGTSGVTSSKNRKAKDLDKLKDDDNDNEKRAFGNNKKLLEMPQNRSNVTVKTKPQSTRISNLVLRESYVKLERIDSLISKIIPTKKPKIENNEGNSNVTNKTNTPVTQVEIGEAGEAGETGEAAEQVSEEPEERPSPTMQSRRSTRGRSSNRSKKNQQQFSQEMIRDDSNADLQEPGLAAERETLGSNEVAGFSMTDNSQHQDLSGKQETGLLRLDNAMPNMVHLSNGFYLVYNPAQSNQMAINWEAIGGTVIQTWNVSSASGALTVQPFVQPTSQETQDYIRPVKDPAPGFSTGVELTKSQAGESSPALNKVPTLDTPVFAAEANEIRESFSDMTTGDASEQRRGPQQPNEQAAFWSGIQRSPANNENANTEQPAMVQNIPNTEMINANFLRTLLAEHQVQHGPIPAENSEFVSLERLAAQHQQSRFNLNAAEITTPMDQLTQQVRRMANPSPQISMISLLQAPPPLHPAGVPMSQPRIVSQPSTSYDALNHLPPIGPPPLFQAFSVYPNRGTEHGMPQLIAAPPALQQCPQVVANAYQNVVPTPATRQKSKPAKRNNTGPPPPPELILPKQRRSADSATKGKSQPSKGKGKGKGKGKAPAKPPTKGTRTPKKPLDPKTVAEVLAARGITVTPSPARQPKVQKKSQQKTATSSPVINIGSAISITPSSQNKNNGGKKNGNAPAPAAAAAAPAPAPTAPAPTAPAPIAPAPVAAPGSRRNSAPIINNNVERPERCATVDLTDEDEPQVDLNAPGPSVNRFQCDHCRQKFPTAVSLELHKGSHQEEDPDEPAHRCDICNIVFSTAEELERHRMDTHKYRGRTPNWVIPVVDLDFPGAEERLVEFGINNFIPVSLDDDEGSYAIPIIQHNSPRTHRNLFGVSNFIVLGQMGSFYRPRHN